uniref:Uncharacterized protein n=1 Tax=Glossina palpalis gambiensis TaxID=67801 RepID=A0A1B0B9K1_9MUSC
MEKPPINQENNWDSQSVDNYQSVDNIKRQMRKGNWTYIWRHPEVNKQLQIVNKELKKGQWSHHDCDMVFSETDSSHSLLSSSSVGPDIDSMLRYAVLLRDKNISKK